MRRVDVARLGVEGDPRAARRAESDDEPVRREARRPDRLGHLLAPNHGARHRVPQPQSPVVAARQELRLRRVRAHRPQVVRVADHHRLERGLDEAGHDAITRRPDEHAIVLALGHRPYRPVLLWNLRVENRQRYTPDLYRCPLN